MKQAKKHISLVEMASFVIILRLVLISTTEGNCCMIFVSGTYLCPMLHTESTDKPSYIVFYISQVLTTNLVLSTNLQGVVDIWQMANILVM